MAEKVSSFLLVCYCENELPPCGEIGVSSRMIVYVAPSMIGGPCWRSMIGPLLIFDKSFLQMLNPEEVSELSLHFKFVGTPTLIGEIIADLKLEPSKRRLPSEVVQALSRKMQKAHGLLPANYRKLALANIYAHEIPMIGQVPVDGAAPNVRVTEDRRGLLYDSTPEQILWNRWANGEFSTEDELTATTWRNGIDQIDLDGLAALWKNFSLRHFSSTRNQDELASALDVFLRDSAPSVQREILNMTLDLMKASAQHRRVAHALMNIGEMRSVLEFAPYAASVLRLFLAFVCGLARGFIGPRPTNYIDLQYLYYSPFCMVFVSNDKFHREMWGATSGVHSFVWGKDLKEDLRGRITMRAQMKESTGGVANKEDTADAAVTPPSVIAKMWGTHMRVRDKPDQPERARTFENLAPEIQQQFKNAMKEFDKIDRAQKR